MGERQHFTGEMYTDINPLFVGENAFDPSNDRYGPRICDYTIIHFVLEGHGVLVCEGKEYQVSEGQMFIIYAGEVAKYESRSEKTWKYVWAAFDGIYQEKLSVLEGRVFSVPRDIYEDLFNKIIVRNIDRTEVLAKIYQTFAYLLPVDENRKSGYPETVSNIIKLNYMNKTTTVDKIANQLSIDRRYMTRIFKEKYGKTVSEYLIELRMKKAAEFLRGGYSVSDVSSMVGYNDVFNFSKMFKKVFSVSPKEFQKKDTKI